MKKLKTSRRGLTFSFDETERFYPGSHYTYFITDTQIVIYATDSGTMTVSRKKTGKKIKSLLDIRKKSVVEKVQKADFMEVSFEGDQIIVHLRKAAKSYQKCNNIYSIADILDSSICSTYHVPISMLAAGCEYQQLTINDWLSNNIDNSSVGKVKNDLKKVFSVISLFSGAGMLDYPFYLDKNFDICFACDNDHGATKTYKENIGGNVFCGNIKEVSGLKKSDVVIGGPSCKAFSNANRSTTRLLEHPDYFLVKEYIRIVKESKPSIFVIENVPEFITANDGDLLNAVIQELPEYETTANMICDADVGGYTSRKRVFLIGSKIGKIILPAMKVFPRKTVREALSKVDSSWFNYDDITVSRPETVKKMSYIRNGHNWEDVPTELRGKSMHSSYLRRLEPNSISPTLTNFRKTCLLPPVESPNPNRILTVAEASALSGFPKEFHFLGKLSERQQQVGNGVPFAMGEFVKNAIKKALLKNLIPVTAI